VDFFDAIDGKLYDMGDSASLSTNYGQNLPWGQYDHKWDVNAVADSQYKTEGWIWPVVDYGAINATDFSAPVNVRYQRPGFFIKTAIGLMLNSAGYKATGSLLADPLYPLMICQFANGSFEHGTDYQNQPDGKGCQVATAADQTFVHNSVRDGSNVGKINFTNIVSNPSGFWTDNKYVPDEIIAVDITLTIPRLRLQGRATTDSPASVKIYIRLLDSNSDTNLAVFDFDFSNGYTGRISGDGGGLVAYVIVNNSTLSFSTTLSPTTAEGIQINYEFLGLSHSQFTLYSGAILTVKAQNKTIQFGQTIQCERIFPDISQKDLLKDTLQRFGIICQTDNASKTISFNSLRDIVNNIPMAKDWSSKCLDQGKQVAFKLGSYAQINYMQYQDDDNVLPKKFGWSQITIADQTLPAGAELFTSTFAPTLNRPYYGGTIAQIKTIDDTSDSKDFSISVSPRILIDQKTKLPNGKPVTFTDGNGNNRVINDVISTPYFYKDDGQYSLKFDDLRKKYYPELEKILTQTKKVVRYILLTPRDILELDLLIPVYIAQDSAYYYINKIDAWRKGQPAKVELVKLG